MNREGLLKAISASGVPERLKSYLRAFVCGGSGSELRRRLKADPGKVLVEIAGVIDLAAGVLSVPGEEALFASGFHPGNLAPARLEAALAELRAAVFLAGEGFSSISFMPPARGKTADLTASRGGNTYAFEVRCVTGGSSFFSGFVRCGNQGFAAGEKAVSLLEKKYRKKMPQAACCRKKDGLSHSGLVFVISAAPGAPVSESRVLAGLAAALYEQVGRPGRAHICLLAGGEAGVFPGWER